MLDEALGRSLRRAPFLLSAESGDISCNCFDRLIDAGGKPQGAPGIDIAVRTADGKVIVGELKTTKPYQPGFGAAQRATILKDLARLATTAADYRFMFVVDPDTFQVLCSKSFASKAPQVEVIDLVMGKTFVCAGS